MEIHKKNPHAIRVNRIWYNGAEWILGCSLKLHKSWEAPETSLFPADFISSLWLGLLANYIWYPKLLKNLSLTNIQCCDLHFKGSCVAKLPHYMLHSWGQWSRDIKCKHQIKERDATRNKPEGHISNNSAVCTETHSDNWHKYPQRVRTYPCLL